MKGRRLGAGLLLAGLLSATTTLVPTGADAATAPPAPPRPRREAQRLRPAEHRVHHGHMVGQDPGHVRRLPGAQPAVYGDLHLHWLRHLPYGYIATAGHCLNPADEKYDVDTRFDVMGAGVGWAVDNDVYGDNVGGKAMANYAVDHWELVSPTSRYGDRIKYPVLSVQVSWAPTSRVWRHRTAGRRA